jgi:hypothetical protein
VKSIIEQYSAQGKSCTIKGMWSITYVFAASCIQFLFSPNSSASPPAPHLVPEVRNHHKQTETQTKKTKRLQICI